MKICDLKSNDKPRERLQRLGPAALCDYELLAILLRTGYGSMNAISLAQHILGIYGLDQLNSIGFCKLSDIKGIGPAKASEIIACFELGRRIRTMPNANSILDSSEKAAAYLSPEMENLDREHFRVLLLDSRHRLIRHLDISIGTLDSSLIHPREVFKAAIADSASSMIIAHNHPSGDPGPSNEDNQVTRIMKDAGRMMGIDVIDHIIIGKGSYFSYADRQLL